MKLTPVNVNTKFYHQLRVDFFCQCKNAVSIFFVNHTPDKYFRHSLSILTNRDPEWITLFAPQRSRPRGDNSLLFEPGIFASEPRDSAASGSRRNPRYGHIRSNSLLIPVEQGISPREGQTVLRTTGAENPRGIEGGEAPLALLSLPFGWPTRAKTRRLRGGENFQPYQGDCLAEREGFEPSIRF